MIVCVGRTSESIEPRPRRSRIAGAGSTCPSTLRKGAAPCVCGPPPGPCQVCLIVWCATRWRRDTSGGDPCPFGLSAAWHRATRRRNSCLSEDLAGYSLGCRCLDPGAGRRIEAAVAGARGASPGRRRSGAVAPFAHLRAMFGRGAHRQSQAGSMFAQCFGGGLAPSPRVGDREDPAPGSNAGSGA
jgi:hypothetical protein